MPTFSGVGAPNSIGPANGGKIYANSALTTLVTVAPANPSRRSITFHNPGPIDIFIGPVLILNASTGTQSTLTPTTAAYGGCFRIFANGGSLTITGECSGAWQALTSDASSGQLTVMDSNVG